jgi:hypothetical protein
MMRDTILAAFERGRHHALQDLPRSGNPFMPEAEAEQWEAWNAGYDEEEPRYVVAH